MERISAMPQSIADNSKFDHSIHAKLELERNFYSHLYIDRIERAEIESLISAMRPVLVRGLPGVGKTVVVKKIKGSFENTNLIPLHI
jgi:MoxR-like ATPase